MIRAGGADPGQAASRPAGARRSLLVTVHFEGAREFATVHARAVNLLDGYVNA